MLNGYILLHRQLLGSEAWKLKPESFKVLITILLKVNFQPGSFYFNSQIINVNAGQTITSIENLAKDSGPGISVRNVRTALNQLTKLDFLTYETTNRYTLITVVNWAKYQTIKSKPTNKTTKKRQRSDKEATKNRQQYKNDNNDMNEKKGEEVKKDIPANIPAPNFLDIDQNINIVNLTKEQKAKRFHQLRESLSNDSNFINQLSKTLNASKVDLSISLDNFFRGLITDEKREKEYPIIVSQSIDENKFHFKNWYKKGLETRQKKTAGH